MKILLIDNYDSFTYNLVHYVEEHNYKVQVFRNDKITSFLNVMKTQWSVEDASC